MRRRGDACNVPLWVSLPKSSRSSLLGGSQFDFLSPVRSSRRSALRMTTTLSRFQPLESQSRVRFGKSVSCLAVCVGFLSFFAAVTFEGAAALGAQDYVVDTWQTEDGLPQNSVTALAQTRDGYLWVGTQDGLARFDGVRFVPFDAHNTPAIRNSRIVQLFEDRKGALWIGTEDAGMVRSDGRQLTAFSAPNQGTAYNYARVLCDDAEGGLWIATCENQLVRWRGGAFTVVSSNWNLTGTSVSAVAGELTGQVWVGTDRELAV